MKKICPICKSDRKVRILQYENVNGRDKGVWFCFACCHAWRTEPWKFSSQKEHFSVASYTKIENSERLDATKMEIFNDLVQWANTIRKGNQGLAVDFGCSYGTLMELFKKNNWGVVGIEISTAAQKILDEKGLIWAADIDEAGLESSSVDIIVLSDCIYYLSDPIGELVKLKKYIKKDGCLFIRQATRAGIIRMLFYFYKKKIFNKYLWGDHVHIFSKHSTELVLKKAGFTKLDFSREGKFKRTFKHELVHRILKYCDIMTFGVFDIALSYIVKAKIDWQI